MTLKFATSLDGRIATSSGESRWITGEAARAQVHRLRAEHDAVVVGIGTALADDPELTVRLPGYGGPQPARVVLDSRHRLPLHSKLARSAGEIPTYIVSAQPAAVSPSSALRRIEVGPDGEGRPDLESAVRFLKSQGLDRLFVEGGGEVAASFLRSGLVDRLEWFRAPILLGAGGRPSVGALALARLADASRFRRVAVQPLGEDLWERYERG